MENIIKWRDSYNTEINSMDIQHKKLIELINKLYRMIRSKESIDLIGEVLDEMKIYSEKHFQDEEILLETNSYLELANHKAKHQEYINTLKDLMVKKVNNDNEVAVKEAYAFLRKWWLDHIVIEDRKYGELLKSKGVS